MYSNRTFLAASIVLLLSSPAVTAQTGRGTIRGSVQDQTQAAIPGVEVTAEQLGTNIRFAAVTSEDGTFAFLSLPPSNYRLTAELPGFKRALVPNVVVHIGEITRVNLTLELGELTETVEVMGSTLQVTPDTTAAGTVITATEFESLPLAGSSRSRIATDFALLTPGVIGGQQRPGRDHVATTALSVDGSQNLTTDVLVEGMSGGQFQNFGSFTEVGIPVDSVQEFNLIKGILPAEYGYVRTSLLSFSLKSGTNDLRGSLFHNMRNDIFNARSFFELEKLPLRHNNFGGSVGGPVHIPGLYAGKDRTFFFFTYDRSLFRGTSVVQVYTSPTEAMLRGDFSELRTPSGELRQIYDPATTAPGPAGGYTREPFPGNIIPEDRMSPIARTVASLIPSPNMPGVDTNFVGRGGAARLDTTFYNTKIDHWISERHRFSGTYNYTQLPRHVYGNPYEGTPLLTGLNQDIGSRGARLTYDFVISSRTLNHTALGYNRFHNQSASYSKGEDWVNRLGLQGTIGDDGSMPVFQFSSDGYPKMALERWDGDVEENIMLRNTTSLLRGNHSVKFGFEMRQQNWKPRRWRNQAGTFTFNFRETSLNGSPLTGNSFASFLLGWVDTANISTPQHVQSTRPYYAWFVQDDIKMTPRLTLNVGLRYDLDLPPREQYDRASTFDFETPNPGAGNLPGAMIFAGEGPGRAGTRTFEDTYYRAFNPRLGLAYQLNRLTVVRMGYGISHSTHRLLNSHDGFSTTQTFISPDLGRSPAFLLDNGIPTDWPKPPFIDPTVGNNNNVSATIRSESARMPMTQVWRLDVQRELPHSTMAEISYVGTRGTHLNAALRRINDVDARYLELGGLLTANIHSPAAREAGIPIPYEGFNGTVRQALRAFPHVLNVNTSEDKLGSSIYHSAQLKVQKRAAGLNYLVSYAFSKTLTDVPAGMAGVSASAIQDAGNRKAEWAVATFDTPHSLSISALYDLPFGQGARFLDTGGLANAVLGGWKISTILTYQSGLPLRIMQNNRLPLFNAQQRPNRVPGVAPRADVSYGDFDPAVHRLLDFAAFSDAGAFAFGDASPRLSDAREFGTRSEDVALHKSARIHEQVRLEVRAQAFNIFNRPYWGTANVNFSSSDFGRVNTAGPGRQIQLGLRLVF
jgi:hypothetical protein